MRNIKFKVYSTVTGSFDFMTLTDLIMYNPEKISIKSIVEDLKFLEFTGIKDKNGVEIYEGDIIRTESGVYEVTIEDSSYMYLVNAGVHYNYNEDYYEGGHSSVWPWGTFEVIGNVYNNPQLLDGDV